MKEERYFYVPNAIECAELPDEEAQHAVRVLRMQPGDELTLMDGCGSYHRAVITEATKKRCLYRIEESQLQPRQWEGHLHLAMGPTKNMDRTEWFAEKATEIGFDELTFLNCKFSERTVIKTERIDKILVSAMKQSRKPWKPILNEMTDFKHFISSEKIKAFDGKKFICHCYEEPELCSPNADATSASSPKPLLMDELQKGEKGDVLVLVGPEGDFSVDEVKMAMEHGFMPVSLGKSRLRTETAALVAVHLMHIFA